MSIIFISYAREDLEFVRRLHGALADREREAWVDFEGIPPSAEWLAEIRAAIDSADAFVFVLTPDSVASKVASEELRHAVEQHKRLIPVLRREVDDAEIARELAELNWIFFRDGDDFEAGCRTLLEAVDTDLGWVRDHTRLLKRAREWETSDRDASSTLRGRDLRVFEDWLARGPDMEPPPTALQAEYVLASRRAASIRQRVVWGSVALGLVVAVALSLVAYFQSREKSRQREIAAARQLINRAEALRNRPPDELGVRYLEQSVVAAVQALSGFDRLEMRSVEADRAVRAGMALLPRLVSKHELGTGELEATATEASGRYLAVAQGRRRLVVWDALEREERECEHELATGVSTLGLAVEPSGSHMAVSAYSSSASVDASTLTVIRIDDCSTRFRVRLPGRQETLRLGHGGRRLALLVSLDVTVWDVEGGAEVDLALGDVVVYDLAFHPREDRVAVLLRTRETREFQVRILDPAGSPESVVPLPERARRLTWTSDGAGLLVHFGKSLAPYEIATGEWSADIPYSGDAVALSADGQLLAEQAGGYAVGVRDLDAGGEIARLVEESGLEAMFFTGEHGSLVTLRVDHDVRETGFDGGRWLHELREPAQIAEVEFSVDSSLILTRAGEEIVSWELPASALEAPRRLARVDEGPAPAFRRAEVRTSSETHLRQVVIVDARFGSEVETLEFEGEVLAVALARTGDRLAVALGESTRGGWKIELRIVNLGGDGGYQSIAVPGFVEDRSAGALELSADGRYLVAASRDGVRIWDPSTLELVTELIHPGATTIAFQPGGSLLATAAGTEVRVWDLEAGLEGARIDNGAALQRLALSPDGRLLATVSDGAARLWALEPEVLIEQACARVTLPCDEQEGARVPAGSVD